MRIERIGQATLYLGDCLEVLPTLDPMDAIITDPQYGVGIDYEGHGDELQTVTAHTINFVKIASSKARVLAFTAGKWETELALYQQHPPRWRMVWYKGAQSTASPIGFNDWEAVLVYGDKVHNNAHDYFYAQPEPMGNHGHPCPKPVRYTEILIARLSKPGGVICDPFFGSGSAGVAAVNAGRPFVGIELEPKFFDIGCERIANAQRQERLFA
jgi:site-specific DNA-methyltransferase (adenine-specific)